MRLHLDTSVLIDWYRANPRLLSLRDEILAGVHVVSIDPIVEVEYFAAVRVERQKIAIFDSIALFSDWIAPTVVTSLIDAGLRIEFLHEFPYSTYQFLPFTEELAPGKVRLTKHDGCIPLLFSIKATKRA